MANVFDDLVVRSVHYYLEIQRMMTEIINRLKLLKQIHEQLNPCGCIILIEKVLGESNEFNRQFIRYYYDMKRCNNYADTEITQKREAL